MKLTDAMNAMGITRMPKYADEVNPLDIASGHEFDSRKPGDHRVRAVERVIRAKVPFTSEQNCFWELVKKLITVTCPYCGKKMQYTGGGGSSHHVTSTFSCECKTTISLSSDYNGISVIPPK